VDDIKVSVCMMTYNHERYIAQAVESALSQQTTFPIEIVIGEDCSTDRTQEILRGLAEQHPKTIRLHLAERNMGVNPNFLKTIARCSGQYVAMLEGDDYWTSADKLQRQVDALDAHPEWAMCFHPCACLYEDEMQGIPIYPLGWTKPVATIDDLFLANFMPTSGVLFRNRLFPEFPGWFSKLLIGDWALHILNAAHGNIGFIPEIMSAYRVHRAGVWSGATTAERLVGIFEVFSAIDHHFAGKYRQEVNTYRAAAIRHLVSQVDTVASCVSDVAEQLDSAQVQMDEQTLARVHTQAYAEAQTEIYARAQQRESVRANRLEIQLKTVHSERQRLLSDLAQLEGKYVALAEDTHRLQAFYNTWTKSILYRVEREIRRPFRRLRKYLRNRRQGEGGQSPPSEPSISKAA
jgi:glycosyltransferase involved in cell wall biosynthesis